MTFVYRIALAALMLFALGVPDVYAGANNNWYWNKFRLNSRYSAFAIELGTRFMGHFARSEAATTPPDTLVGEIQGTYWFPKRWLGIYGTMSYRYLIAQSFQIGAGAKLRFITLRSVHREDIVGGVIGYLVIDGVYHYLRPSPSQYLYNERALVARWGLATQWGIGPWGTYLNIQMMVMFHNDAFMIAPYMGVGYEF